MPKTAADVLTDAATVLQDETHVRWGLPELAKWLNEAQLAIVNADPSANSETVVVSLVEGTLQSLTDAEHLQLLRLTRNMKGTAPDYTGGRAIRLVLRGTLDASAPDWHDGEVTPFKQEVRQYFIDENASTEFYVYPGNDGTGKVEALVSVMPEMIETTGNDIGDYEDQGIGLDDTYAPAMLDYILYRAFSKDDPAAEVTRAQLHYRAFGAAVGLKDQSERAAAPGGKR